MDKSAEGKKSLERCHNITLAMGLTAPPLLDGHFCMKKISTCESCTHGTWRDGRRNALMGNDPEKVPNMQKTNPKSYKRNHTGRKG